MAFFYFLVGCACVVLLRHVMHSAASIKPASMERGEAVRLLGVSEKASEAEISEAYRRLMQKNHPDHGGTEYLASKINQARDILLK